MREEGGIKRVRDASCMKSNEFRLCLNVIQPIIISFNFNALAVNIIEKMGT